MSTVDVNTSFALTLVDEWARSGVRHAVVAPGSRNTPLVLALARDDRIAVDVVLDERSAAFRALGIARATGRPAIVCCTSGTAAANLHPAVIEAHHARVPLVVCTADRPPELRDWGAGQTIDQTHLFGRAVNWFCDPGPPELAGSGAWRSFACRAIASALGPPAGPVHLNLPFREPLLPTGESLLDPPARAHAQPWTRVTRPSLTPAGRDVDDLRELVRANPRGLIVAGFGADTDVATVGRFAAAAGWPILADPISNLRSGPLAISTYEGIVRTEPFTRAHRPELVLQLGAPATSKALNAWLAGVPHVLVDPDAAWLDPSHAAAHQVRADATPLLDALAAALTSPPADESWLRAWLDAESAVRVAIDKELDADDTACEARIARDLARTVEPGGALMVASSLPVRALEWVMEPRNDLTVFANRGANGIDGFVSTALGIARARGPVVALCGDLCFLHDVNGLLAARSDTPATFVVVDNGGGGIFSYLPQAEQLPAAEFERLFATPQAVDVAAVARLYGAAVHVVVISVGGAASRARHARLWDAAATALS
jgi:2-succinyl-5-enolpyruvyl-6-hydroxy-3-cyclohexene-1-carboxylate synthase